MEKNTYYDERLAELEAICAETAERCIAAEKRYCLSTRRMKLMGGLAAFALVAGMLISPGNKAIAQGYGESFSKLVADVNTLKSEMSTQENKTKYMSTSGTTTTFTACNVQIVNGLGATDGNPNDVSNVYNDAVTNGLGNLFIGYNSIGGGYNTCSHNLILGDGNGYTSYGGIVSGKFNTIAAPYASITGGISNIADGNYSSITGGDANTANAQFSTVTSGEGNTADGTASSISGGSYNHATGLASSIAGGANNLSPGMNSSCLGGYICESDDPYSACLGGYNSTVNTGNGYTHFP